MEAMRVRFILSVFIMALLLFTSTSAEFYSKSELAKKSLICLDCHEDRGTSLDGSPHQLTDEMDIGSSLVAGCIGCHDQWETHIEDPAKGNIGLPASASPVEQAEICARCHLSPRQIAMTTTDPHYRDEMSCLSCHTIHFNHNKMLVKDEQENYCVACHQETVSEFARRSAHPLESGNIRCSDCHDLSGTKDQSLAMGMDWSCQECHAELSGPFLYEHPVVNDHMIDGGGCIECHQPHGSPNDRLLNQPGNGVCLQCHAVPSGHRTEHSGLGTKLACVECHSQTHGSYDNRLFLDPELGIKLFPDCYQSGCHNLGN